MNDNKLTDIRRKDRLVIDEEWVKDILRYEPFCVVGTADDKQPFLRPTAFYYHEQDHAIYIHGAHEGRGFGNLRDNNLVSLCLYVTGRMRGNSRAFDFFQEHAGVIVFGHSEEIKDNDKKHAIMQSIFEKHTPHLKANIDYEPASQEEIDSTSIFRIEIDDWTGKMKWTDVEPEFSFYYEDVRGNRRANLPWLRKTGSLEPLTEEWEKSENKH